MHSWCLLLKFASVLGRVSSQGSPLRQGTVCTFLGENFTCAIARPHVQKTTSHIIACEKVYWADAQTQTGGHFNRLYKMPTYSVELTDKKQ